MSNELKVTGGEWEIVEKKYKHVVSSWFIKIGEVELGFFPYKRIYSEDKTQSGLVRDEEQHANARLLAASKKLYEALEQTLLELESHQRSAYCSLDGCFDETLEAARSALAAARGEDQ